MARMSFDEEVKTEFEKIITDMIDDYNNLSYYLNNEITEVYKKTKYEKLGLFANSFFEIYNDEILSAIIPQFTDKWRDSESSLLAYSKKMSVGDSAENFIQGLETIIEDALSVLKRMDEIELLADGEIDISDKAFKDISDVVNKSKKKHDDTYEQTITTINTYVEQNTAVAALRPVLEIVPTVFSVFNEKLDKAFDQFAENFKARLKEQEDTNDDFTNSMANKAANFKDDTTITSNKPDTPSVFANAPAGSSFGGGQSNKKRSPICFKKLKEFADLHYKNPAPKNTKELTKYIYNAALNQMYKKNKAIPYEIISKLMVIYEDYYASLGTQMVWTNSSRGGCETREKHSLQEYLGVLKTNGNMGLFKGNNDDDYCTFLSHYKTCYSIFDIIARMVSNICEKLDNKDKDVSENNLIYALYIFTEIFDTSELPQSPEYDEFSVRAAKKIYEIIGEEFVEIQKKLDHSNTSNPSNASDTTTGAQSGLQDVLSDDIAVQSASNGSIEQSAPAIMFDWTSLQSIAQSMKQSLNLKEQFELFCKFYAKVIEQCTPYLKKPLEQEIFDAPEMGQLYGATKYALYAIADPYIFANLDADLGGNRKEKMAMNSFGISTNTNSMVQRINELCSMDLDNITEIGLEVAAVTNFRDLFSNLIDARTIESIADLELALKSGVVNVQEFYYKGKNVLETTTKAQTRFERLVDLLGSTEEAKKIVSYLDFLPLLEHLDKAKTPRVLCTVGSNLSEQTHFSREGDSNVIYHSQKVLEAMNEFAQIFLGEKTVQMTDIPVNTPKNPLEKIIGFVKSGNKSFKERNRSQPERVSAFFNEQSVARRGETAIAYINQSYKMIELARNFAESVYDYEQAQRQELKSVTKKSNEVGRAIRNTGGMVGTSIGNPVNASMGAVSMILGTKRGQNTFACVETAKKITKNFKTSCENLVGHAFEHEICMILNYEDCKMKKLLSSDTLTKENMMDCAAYLGIIRYMNEQYNGPKNLIEVAGESLATLSEQSLGECQERIRQMFNKESL